MHLKQHIFTALLILFVLTGQTMAAQGVNSCDMNMHQMNHKVMDMPNGKMDCCDDDPVCAMDCSLAMVSVIFEPVALDLHKISGEKINIPSVLITSQPSISLFRPPISA